MARVPSDFFPRKPRYTFIEGSVVDAVLEIDQPDAPARLPLRMIDLSRNGFCGEVEYKLAIGLSTVLHLAKNGQGPMVELPGTVCWQRARQSGTVVVGCRFAEELPWETLGELFLEGVLST